MKVKLEDITPETLDQIAWEWEEARIGLLVREHMVTLGQQLARARAEAGNAELRAKMRALKLHRDCEMPAKEIAELLDIEVKEVRCWLK